MSAIVPPNSGAGAAGLGGERFSLVTLGKKDVSPRSLMLKLFLIFWAFALLVFMSAMMVSHLAALPSPPPGPVNWQSATWSTLPNTVVTTNALTATPWQMIHVLVAECPCSAYTAQALIRRGPLADCRETVWVVGGQSPWESELTRAGFKLQEKAAEQLAKDTGIAGGPWLLILSPAGEIVYSGGYADQRPRPGIQLQDVALLAAVRRAEKVSDLPAYGCAATAYLKGQLDPVGVCRSIQ